MAVCEDDDNKRQEHDGGEQHRGVADERYFREMTGIYEDLQLRRCKVGVRLHPRGPAMAV